MSTLQYRAVVETLAYFEVARELYNLTYDDLPDPEICFKLRGKTAGTANWGYNKIRYNYKLLNENGEDFLARTVPHEVAHIVAYVVYGPFIKPHGREWKSVMIRFGADPTRCHSYKVAPRKRQGLVVFKCECPDKTFEITKNRATRIENRSTNKRFCRTCKFELRRA